MMDKLPLFSRRQLLQGLLPLGLASCQGLAQEVPPHDLRWILDGLDYRILIDGRLSASSASELSELCRQEARRLHAIVNDFDDRSEISLLNASAGRGPRAVSPELWEILTCAQDLWSQSGGAFDISCGPLLVPWRMARHFGRRPPQKMIDQARRRCGFDKVVCTAPNQVQLSLPGMKLDLGGISQGFIAGRLLQLLMRSCPVAAVDVSGDMAFGASAQEAGWPVSCPGQAPELLHLRNCGFTLSSDEAQFSIIDGVRHSHTIDPRSGEALRNAPALSVIAPQAIIADGLATALSVLPLADGLVLLRRYPGTAARWQWPAHADQAASVFASPLWP